MLMQRQRAFMLLILCWVLDCLQHTSAYATLARVCAAKHTGNTVCSARHAVAGSYESGGFNVALAVARGARARKLVHTSRQNVKSMHCVPGHSEKQVANGFNEPHIAGVRSQAAVTLCHEHT